MKKLLEFIKNDFIRIMIGSIIILLALSATVVSTYLSCIGLLYLLDILKIKIQGTKEFVVIFVILLQSMVFFGSVAKGFIFKYCPQHFRFISKFTNIAFFISVLSTITFFAQFDKTDRYNAITDIINLIPIIQGSFKQWIIDFITNVSLIYIGAIALDIMSMKFPNIGTDLIFKIATNKKIIIKDNSFFSRIKNIIFHLLDNLISNVENKVGIKNEEKSSVQKKLSTVQDKKSSVQCTEKKLSTVQNENSSVQKKLSTVQNKKSSVQCTEKKLSTVQEDESKNSGEYELSTKKPETLVIDQCTESSSTCTEQKKSSVQDKKDSSVHCTEKEKSSVQYEKSSVQEKLSTVQDEKSSVHCTEKKLSTVQNENSSVQDEKSSVQEKLSTVQKIDEYILMTYEIESLIPTNFIRQKFNLEGSKNKRKWDKIRNQLQTCKIVNGKLRRIETSNKLKRVK